MPGTNQTVITRRKYAYAALFTLLLVAYFPLRGLAWQHTQELHTLMECVATILALCVGALGLVRYYSKKENTFLFIGTGFFTTGLLDAYHAVITASGFRELASAFPASHIAWSWFGSRLFFSMLLWLSWVFWKREQRLGNAGRISEHLVYEAVGVGFLVFFAFFTFIPLNAIYHENLLFPRPQEFAPALFFLLALIGYLRKNQWKTDPFEHWLVLALIAGFMCEALYMPSSRHMDDLMYCAAHVLKIVSYGCAFIGLLANLHHLFSESLTHQELALKNLILTTQQETSQDAILVVDENATIITYNRRFVDLWGVPEEMVRRRDDTPVLQFVVTKVANPEEFHSRVKYLYEHKSEESFEEIPLKDGRIIDRYSAPMIGHDGKYYGRIWYLRDVTEKKRAEQLVRESEEKYRSLIDQSLVGIALIEDGRFSYVNRRLADIFGYGTDEMMRLGPVDIASDKDKPVIMETTRRYLHSEGNGDEFTFQGVRKNGSLVDVEGRSARMHVGGKLVLMVIIMDISERVRAEREVHTLQEKLREQAIRDPLTGLYNRRYLGNAIKDELARAARGVYPISLVMGDIDHFKVINDSYGHLAGDEVLRKFSRLIKKNARSSDIVCRYGGEEFLMVLPGMTKKAAMGRTEKLRLAFAEAKIPHETSTLRATASFGVSTFPEDGQDVAGLITAADKALYAAKDAGRNQVRAAAAQSAPSTAGMT